MADADDIRDAAAANAAAGISSHANDGTQTTAMDPLKQMQVADKVAANAAGEHPHCGMRIFQLRPGGTG